MQAATGGRVSSVAALLEAGANPNHVAKQGETALVVASQPGEVEVGRLLSAKGARLEATFLPAQTTALQPAARLGHAAFVELLLHTLHLRPLLVTALICLASLVWSCVPARRLNAAASGA
jgi:ankyrin repeat protein